MAFLKNTLSSTYWLVRGCCVTWVAWGNSVMHFIYLMFMFLKLWIKKNNQTEHKKSIASPFWNLHLGLILLLWACTYSWYCSCNDLILQFLCRLCFLFLIPFSKLVQGTGCFLSLSSHYWLNTIWMTPCGKDAAVLLPYMLWIYVLLWWYCCASDYIKNCQKSPKLAVLF